MSLQIGIIGLPNVGKSTLFNALTKQKVLAENYPFATIDPNVGVVPVPDERLQKIADVEKSEKIIPTTVEFVDIAGLVKDAHKGEGLGNKFLSHIREVDAIAEVVRFFEDDNVHHVDGSVNGERDIDTIKTELIFADLETVQKRLKKLESDTKSGDKIAIKKFELAKKVENGLSEGKRVIDLQFTEEEQASARDFQLLTAKPFLYIANVSNDSFPQEGEIISIDAKLESELAELGDEEKAEYFAELGIKESGLNRLIKAAYKTLNLITFLTAGPKESRAWTVIRGATAPNAAGQIHTDFERGFIKADVIRWEKLVEAGSWAKARDKGQVRTEGKEYVVQDGDVMLFKFNV